MINPDTPSNLMPHPPPGQVDRHTETTIHQLLAAHGLLLNRARRDVLHVLLLAQHPLDVDGALAAARNERQSCLARPPYRDFSIL